MIRRRRPTKEVFIEDVAVAASACCFTAPGVVNAKEKVNLFVTHKITYGMIKDLILTLLHYLKTLLKIIHNTDILIVRIINIPLLSIIDRLFSVSANLEMKNLVTNKRDFVQEFIQNATCLGVTAGITKQSKRRCYRIFLV